MKSSRSKLLESLVQDRIIKYLKSRNGWLFKVHGGAHQRSGIPDILYMERGRFYAIEIKRSADEQPSPIQLFNLNKLHEQGAIVGVAWSVETAKAIIEGEVVWTAEPQKVIP